MRRNLDRTTLRRDLSALLRRRPDDARSRLTIDHHSDPIDEARWTEDASVAIEQLDIDREDRRNARAALERLQDGTYGQCVTCGGEISESRLAAVPWATRCVRCQERREAAAVDDGNGPTSVRDWLDVRPDAA